MTQSGFFSQSFRSASRSWQALLVLYLGNLLLAAVVAFGFSSALRAGFGDSMLPERLLEGFDATVFNDFFRGHENFLRPYFVQIAWVTIFWMILNTLLGGGIVKSLQRGGSSSFSEFFSDCGLFVKRFFFLFLFSTAFLIVVGTIWSTIMFMIYAAMTVGTQTEVSNVVGALMTGVAILIPMILVMMVFDYARVRIVVDDTASIFTATWQATKFVFRNFAATFGWQILMLIFLLLLAVLYWLVMRGFDMASGFGIFLGFIIQQISVGSRLWGRLAMIGGQVQLHESHRAEEVSVSTAGFMPPPVSPLPPVPSVPVKKAAVRRSAAKRTRRPARRGSKRR